MLKAVSISSTASGNVVAQTSSESSEYSVMTPSALTSIIANTEKQYSVSGSIFVKPAVGFSTAPTYSPNTEDPDTTLEPLPPIVDYSVPTEPVAPESPGFLLAPFALGAAIALRRK